MTELVHTLTLIFVVSSVLLLILDRFEHPAIPAYILAGILVGRFIDSSQVMGLTQLGIAFLVFIFGLKLDPERLKTVARESQATTTVQVASIGLLGYLTAWALGFSHLNALYFSIAASLSSSIVGLQLISEDVRMDLLHGRLAESTQLIQDILAIVAVIALSSAVYRPANIIQNLAFGFGLIAFALFTQRYIFDHVAKLAEGSQELLMLISLATLGGFAALAELGGFSLVVGSFAAGIAVAKFPHNLEILDTVGSLKDFFSAIFFVTLGALINIPSMKVILASLFLAVITAVFKPVVTAVSLIEQGFDSRTAYLTGFSLDQVSEFALIIAIQGLLAGRMDPAIFQSIILAATLTMITSSYTSRHAEELYRLLSSHDLFSTRQDMKNSESGTEMENHVILAGYDTQGRRLAEALNEEGQEFLVVENDPEKVEDAMKKEENYVFGDVMHLETWERASYGDAELIISTIPIGKVSRRILHLDTDADIILRSENVEEASELMEDGALYVAVSKLLASEQLVDHVLGVMQKEQYREELRRKNLLEVRRYLESREG
ncbi:MAG: cation:proton antiporter [Candidatus Nanohaloarchaea archaeon]